MSAPDVDRETDPGWRPFTPGGATATVRACLDRIEALNPVVNALISVAGKAALAAAEACDDQLAHGQHTGILHGMPVVVKDNIDVAGMTTSNGSPAYATLPERDAPVIERLRRAGAIVVGKANLDEFALGAVGANVHFGRCRNPWDPDRVPGGSSGGSAAAVAAAMSVAAIGTDTSGSVRTPAALTGVVGLRPSPGRIPLDGVTPLSPFLDTVGSMARTAADVLRLFLAMADAGTPGGPGGLDVVSAMRELAGVRIGLPGGYFMKDVHPGVAAAVTTAVDVLREGGAGVVDVALPDPGPAHAQLSRMMLADAYEFHSARLASKPDTYGPEVRKRILRGHDVSGRAYSAARRWGADWARAVRAALAEVDVLISPTCPVPAPRLTEYADTIEATAAVTRFTYPWTLAGVPAMSVPCGFVGRVPVGMQLVAQPHREDLLFRVAMNYQRFTAWHQEWPELVRTAGCPGQGDAARNGRDGS